MPRDARFWRNVTIIAVAHIALLFALVRWNRAASNASPASIVWMTPAEAIASSAPPQISAEPAETPAPPAATTPAAPEKESDATPANLKSDIQLPTPTPAPTATPVPKPSVTPTPVPKTSPKPSAKPTPKSTPKKAVVKATPSPKKPVSPAENKKPAETSANQSEKKSDTVDSNGPANGATHASEFAWYGRMLHDRFHNEWQQPTTIVATGAKMTAVVRIRIEKDGRVSSFTIVKPSGNVVVDESVAAIAKRVTQVDPLPKGLVSGAYYEVKINFELNPEQ